MLLNALVSHSQLLLDVLVVTNGLIKFKDMCLKLQDLFSPSLQFGFQIVNLTFESVSLINQLFLKFGDSRVLFFAQLLFLLSKPIAVVFHLFLEGGFSAIEFAFHPYFVRIELVLLSAQLCIRILLNSSAFSFMLLVDALLLVIVRLGLVSHLAVELSDFLL